jgi:hypothetical protein
MSEITLRGCPATVTTIVSIAQYLTQQYSMKVLGVSNLLSSSTLEIVFTTN